MNYRHAVVLANTDYGPSGTEPINIDIKDPISAITLVHQPVGGSNTPAAHPAKNIEKLEIVEGAKPLYSLSGTQGQALNVFEAKKPVIQEIDARTGGTPLTYVHIMFGRRLWDRELALDPTKHVNPQIKLKWNEVNYDASCTSHGFVIFAHVFNKRVMTPLGYLMSKEVKAYEPSSGGNEYTDLPVDYPLRKLILQGMKAGAGVRGLIETIKLSEDVDKHVPIDGDIHELRSFLDEMGGDCIDVIRSNPTAASLNHYCTPHNVFSLTGIGDQLATIVSAGQPVGGRFWGAVQAGATGVTFTVRGKNPHGCICIPFGDQDDLDDYYALAADQNLKLRIKGGTSSASGDEVAVVTQQLVRYA